MFVSYCPTPWLLRFLLFAGASFLFWAVQGSECVWLCPTRSSKLEQRGRRVCLERLSGRTNVTEEERLGRIEKLDPMAEYKYRVRCQNLDSIEAEASVLHSRAPSDLIQCETNDSSLRLPGLDEFQYGYNIVSDSVGYGHSPILAIRSTTEFHASIEGIEDKVCYIVPDSFVSAQDFGISFDVPSSTDFDIIATETLGEFQVAMANARKDELGLKDSGGDFPNKDDSVGAAFAHSEMLSEMKKFTKWGQVTRTVEHSDCSRLSYVQSMYAVHVQTAIPTQAIIEEWKNLHYFRSRDDEEAYFKYFDEFGTHYFVFGELGGQLTVEFTVKTTETNPTYVWLMGEHAGWRAQCVAAKVGDRLFDGGLEERRAPVYCPASEWGEKYWRQPVEHILYGYKIRCSGGLESLCPTSFEKKKFDKWKESIPSKPAILIGNKRWIPQLLDHILVRATVEGGEGERYREVLASFASRYWDLKQPTDPLEQISEPMAIFRDNIRRHLTRYLRLRAFCKMDPVNCLDYRRMSTAGMMWRPS